MNTKEVKRIVEALNDFAVYNNSGEFEVKEYEGINRHCRDKDYAKFCTESSIYETGKEYHKELNKDYADSFAPAQWWSMEYIVETFDGKLMENADREVRISTGSNNAKWKTHNHEEVSHRKEYRIKIYSSYNEPTSSIKRVEVSCFVDMAQVMTTVNDIDLNSKNLGAILNRFLGGQA